MDSNNRYTPEQASEIIKSGEPVFILRGKDVFTPITIEYWIGLMKKSKADPELIKLAEEQAKRIKDWQGKNGFKVADLVSKQKETPSDSSQN